MILAGLLMSATALTGAVSVATALTNEIVSDAQTGLAINGYDPVAYFTRGAPVQGVAAFERSHAGAVWRFRNEGNRAAFIEAPDVYMPRYGGFDPVAIGRGKSVPGNPLYWTIANDKLYLFYDDKALALFSSAPAKYVAEAEANWPDVRANISR